MVLRQLQDLLAGIYDLPVSHDVYDYLFTERERLPLEMRDSPTDEQVLVCERGDSAALGLFLDSRLLERLAAANPVRALHGGNLADCWTALEGVSHLLYLAWNLQHDRAVSLLELELQAEIDKYVATWWLMRAQDPHRYPAELHRVLFERAHVDSALARERVELYRDANRYAARFCRRLEQQLRARPAARSAALAELRRLYRLGRERKLRRIRQYADA